MGKILLKFKIAIFTGAIIMSNSFYENFSTSNTAYAADSCSTNYTSNQEASERESFCAVELSSTDPTKEVAKDSEVSEIEQVLGAERASQNESVEEVRFQAGTNSGARDTKSQVKYDPNKDERLVRARSYYAAHREEIKARRRASYAEHKEERKAKARAYRETHKEKYKAKARAYREFYKEEHKEQARAYREAHREEHRASSRKYYATHKEKCNARAREYYAAHKYEIKAKKRAALCRI